VATTDHNDAVTVNIRGLPNYERITDNLDGKTFKGRNITLTAAQVDSGLTLQSNYKGAADPVSTLTLTATARDPVTREVMTSAPQTIRVKDPAPTSATTTTSSQPTAATDSIPAAGTSAASPASRDFAMQHHGLFSQIGDLVSGRGVATSTPSITMSDSPSATGTSTTSLAGQSFALLNQYLAGSTGRVDSGQIVTALSNGAVGGQDSFLTRPQH
jgi:hypothetical protein